MIHCGMLPKVRRSMKRHRMLLACVVLVLSGTGCGQKHFPVAGDVTLDGQSVAQGTISLEPVDGNGPTTGGRITKGHYELTGGAAPWPGKKLVRISSGRATGRRIAAGTPAPPGTMVDEIVNYIPAIYNIQSKLTCEVVPKRTNHIDFHLKSP